jgi:HK97 family phage major capsid protein
MSKIRAYSILTVKEINDDERTFTGIASTPNTDRMEDIVEPMGAQFTLPIPLFWQHGKGNIKDPIGWVTNAEPQPDGIPVTGQFAKPEPGDPPTLVEELNRAWALVKKKLVRGLSIGFNPLEYVEIKGSYGYRYTKWDWLELSAVAIPANADASIISIKSADEPFARAASGNSAPRNVVVRLGASPGASGSSTSTKGTKVKTTKEQIEGFEAKRAALVARRAEIMEKAAEKGDTLDNEQAEEYDGITAQVKAVDDHLVRLRELEKTDVEKAQPILPKTGMQPSAPRGSIVTVKPNIEPGIKMARFIMAQIQANGNMGQALHIIQNNKRWMDQTPEVAVVAKAAVAAGDTTTAGWAAELVYNENLAGEFIELLRPATILGRIPGLRKVPFNIRVGSQTGGSTGYWVGQAKPIPVSKLTTDAATLAMAKAAGLLVIDEELARSSSPSAELLVRDDLIKTNATFLDVQFVDPNVAAVSNVNPASVTNGVTAIAPSGTTAAALRADVQTMFNSWIQSNLDPTKGVWIMTPITALAISLMQNALGQPEFPGITLNGGTFFGLPVITSMSANIPGSPDSGNMIILLNADDVMVADDGQMVISVSNQASIEMLDSSLQQDGSNGTGASLVSMFQTNSLAIKGVRWINWAKRRSTAVVYIKEAAYVAS